MSQKNIVATLDAPEDITVTLTSESSNWAAGWSDTSKTFHITVFSKSTGEAVPDQTVTLSLAAGSNVTLGLITNPVTDSDGNAVCRATLTGQENDLCQVIASVGEIQSEPFLVELTNVSLPAPRIPVAIDGVIDDDDYNSGVVVTVIAPNLSTGDTVYLVWGDIQVARSVTSVNNNAFSFALTGGSQTLYESLFENKRYEVKFYVVDEVGNGNYSNMTSVLVKRVNGGGGLDYLAAATIVEAENTGYINKAQSDFGVTAFVPNTEIKYQDNDGEDVSITSPLSKASAVTLELSGVNEEGKAVDTWSYPFDLPIDGLQDAGVTTPPGAVPSSVFNTIGRGKVTITYHVTIDGSTYSVPAAKQRTYFVDVIPPGSH